MMLGPTEDMTRPARVTTHSMGTCGSGGRQEVLGNGEDTDHDGQGTLLRPPAVSYTWWAVTSLVAPLLALSGPGNNL